jgi:autophagy-related protein 18
MPHVMVLSSDGYFYSYSIDLERGGECSLMKQYRYLCPASFSTCDSYFVSLLDSGDESNGADGK